MQGQIGDGRAVGSRLALAAAMVAVAWLLTLGFSASKAAADPLAMTFTDSRANVGDQLSDEELFGPPATAPFTAQLDPASGAISAGHLQVPEFSTHISTPVDADVTVDFEIGVIDGSFTPATGALSLSGTAGGTLTANGKECTVSVTPSPLILSTAGSGGAIPRSGAPFTAGLGGPGAIAGEWTNMQAAPVEPGNSQDEAVCNVVEEHIEGPGGVWLEQAGVVPPPPPPPPGSALSCVVPKLKGKTLRRARRALRAAHCGVGKLHKPRHLKLNLLVVKSSAPAAGATLAAGSKVSLRLGPRHRKPRR